MKTPSILRSNRHSRLRRSSGVGLVLAISIIVSAAGRAGAADIPAVIDDFSAAEHMTTGAPRIVVDDASVGGKSHLKPVYAEGVLSATGEITPARGQPGWVSLVLPLAGEGESADLSKYEGIRLRVRVKQGMMSVAANSTKIDNFDYHSAVVPRKGDAITEVRIAFKDMKRGWSEQIPLDPATINSISIVSVGFQPGAFAYDLDEVGFY